jgi:hypothetical protein
MSERYGVILLLFRGVAAYLVCHVQIIPYFLLICKQTDAR